MSNLLKRTIFGLLYVVVMVSCIYLFPSGFGVLALFVMGMCMHEFFTMALGSNMLKTLRTQSILCCAVLFMSVYLHLLYALDLRFALLAIIPLVRIVLAPVVDNTIREQIDSTTVIYTAMLYIGIPISLVPLLVVNAAGEYDGTLLLGLFIIIWLSDVGAYAIGTLLGQKPGAKKLAPSISPKKSWWGFAGAVLFGMLTALVLQLVGWVKLNIPYALLLGVVVSTGAVAGDLVESVWKRRFECKDSGNLIPGHGGMLDRFDSSLVALPLAGLYLAIIAMLQ